VAGGTFTKRGPGALNLTANNTLSGATTVEEGTLKVNGSLASSVITVASAARLGGSGTIGGVVVQGGATAAPGNSIGTLHVAGDITFDEGSIYEVEVNSAGDSDLIKASGAVTINGGEVKVLAETGNYADATTYTILTADDPRTGEFASVTSNLAFLDPTLTYDPNSVYLTMTRNDTSFESTGRTRNQRDVGTGIESLGRGNALFDAILSMSQTQAQSAFDQASGEIHASTRTALLEDSRFLRDATIDRLRSAAGSVGASRADVMAYADGASTLAPATTDRLALWTHGFGAWGAWDSCDNAAKLDRSTAGLFAGVDMAAFEHGRIGAIAGYSSSDIEAKDRRSSSTSDNYMLGVYGSTVLNEFNLRAGAAHTWHSIDTTRTVNFPGINDTLKSATDATSTQLFAELSYPMQVSNIGFEHFANLAYVKVQTDGSSEQGGSSALTSNGASTNMSFSTFGLRAASNSINIGKFSTTLKGTLGWRHGFGDDVPETALAFAGSDAFTIASTAIARNTAIVDAGVEFSLTEGGSISVSYGGQFGSGFSDNSIRANFNVRF
jgi:outer membrane autotransporter protein